PAAPGVPAKTNGQAKVEAAPLALLGRLAMHPRRDEGHVTPGRDLHVIEVEDDRVFRCREEEVPGPSILLESLRLEGRWNVEHPQLRSMSSEDRRVIPRPDGLRPALQQSPDGFLVRRPLSARTHVSLLGDSTWRSAAPEAMTSRGHGRPSARST